MDTNLSYLLQGLAFGLLAGILPGPVMMFAIGQVIKKGAFEGIKVQLGATMLDVVKIILAFALFSVLPVSDTLLGIIAIMGSIFLLYMAYGNFTYQPQLEIPRGITSLPLTQGILGNILNAASYVFWFTVGGPLMIAAQKAGNNVTVIFFVLGFLLSITAIGIAVAFLASRIKYYLSSAYYIYAIKALGIVLVIFSLLFLKQAINYLI
jgi:threonine/homoserine/homoserine lactone efflux protein